MEKDFFNELSESETIISTLKDTLKSEIKDEIKEKIERLEKENKELQKYKENNDKLEKEFENKMFELEQEYERKERELYKRPLKEIVKIVDKKYYTVYREYIQNEKCDKCNNERKLELIDAYGRKHYVECPCSGHHFEKYRIDSIKIGCIEEISLRDGKLRMEVEFVYGERRNYSHECDEFYIMGFASSCKNIIYDYDEFIQEFIKKEKYKKLHTDYHNYKFDKKEDAEKFAEYLNKILEGKEVK